MKYRRIFIPVLMGILIKIVQAGAIWIKEPTAMSPLSMNWVTQWGWRILMMEVVMPMQPSFLALRPITHWGPMR